VKVGLLFQSVSILYTCLFAGTILVTRDQNSRDELTSCNT